MDPEKEVEDEERHCATRTKTLIIKNREKIIKLNLTLIDIYLSGFNKSASNVNGKVGRTRDPTDRL